MKKIFITLESGGKHSVLASYIVGHFAVHRGVGQWRRCGWQLTHIPTGRAAGRGFPNARHARACASELLRLGDWSFTTFDKNVQPWRRMFKAGESLCCKHLAAEQIERRNARRARK